MIELTKENLYNSKRIRIYRQYICSLEPKMIFYNASSRHKLQAMFHLLFAKLNAVTIFCDTINKFPIRKVFSLSSVDLLKTV